VTADRFVVAGLAKVRSPWFAEVARWATSSQLPVEFLKCVSPTEARARVEGGRPVSALLVDAGVSGFDRDLVGSVTAAGAVVIVVADSTERDWAALGATAVLPERFDAATLLACLESHAPRIRSVDALTAPGPAESAPTDGWKAHVVAVTGANGCGTSTTAMAVAQGMAALPGNPGAVALADLAGCGDLAMYHDVGDVVPGLQELVEAHRSRRPSRNEVRRLLHDVDARGYAVLLGLRRSRDWTALRPRSLDAALESLCATFRILVADVRCDLDGEAETGSLDVEERNGASRTTMRMADAVVVCGDASLRGVHALVRTEHEAVRFGVRPSTIVRVVNRAPRSPRRRAELARALAELGSGTDSRLGPVFVPERRNLDVTHSTVGRLPSSLVDPVLHAVVDVLGAAHG